MARKVEIRTSYQNDSRFLLRIQESYSKDPKLTVEDRKNIVSWLKDIVVTLTKYSGSDL